MGVAWFGDESSFQRFIDTYDLTFPTISDDAGEIYSRFAVPSQPATVIVHPDGNTETLFGAVEPDELDAVLLEATSAA